MNTRIFLPLLIVVLGCSAQANAQVGFRFTVGKDGSNVRDGSRTADSKARLSLSYDIPKLIPLPTSSIVSVYAELTTASATGNASSSILGDVGSDLSYSGFGVAFRSSLLKLPVGNFYSGVGAGIYKIAVTDKKAVGGRLFAGFEPTLIPFFAEVGVPLIGDKSFHPGLTASVGVRF